MKLWRVHAVFEASADFYVEAEEARDAQAAVEKWGAPELVDFASDGILESVEAVEVKAADGQFIGDPVMSGDDGRHVGTVEKWLDDHRAELERARNTPGTREWQAECEKAGQVRLFEKGAK